MNILILSENYFPYVSGVPVVVKYLAEGLQKLGDNVSIATASCANAPSEEIYNGISIYRFNVYKNFFHNYNGDIGEYISFVTNFKADVVIIQCSQCVTTDVLLPHLSKIKGKLIFHSHGFSGLESPFFSFRPNLKHTLGTTYNWFESQFYFYYKLRKAIKFFDTTLCLSPVDNSMPYLEKYAKSVHVLDNAADEMFFDSLYCNNTEVIKKYADLENDKFVISCANYQFVKDQISIIDQYYQSSSSKETSLVCIGSQQNSYYEECQAKVVQNEKKYGHRDVHLLVGVPRTDIPALINSAKLYIVASRCERYSISIIEAMSQGVPFISTNVGNAKVLPGGITVDSVSDINCKIDFLLNNKEEYNKYSEGGKSFAYANCRIEAVVSKLNKIIKDL